LSTYIDPRAADHVHHQARERCEQFDADMQQVARARLDNRIGPKSVEPHPPYR
jgi:hypothetical protein